MKYNMCLKTYILKTIYRISVTKKKQIVTSPRSTPPLAPALRRPPARPAARGTALPRPRCPGDGSLRCGSTRRGEDGKPWFFGAVVVG